MVILLRVYVQGLSCRWVWWQTSCRWRKCSLFHSRESQFWESFCKKRQQQKALISSDVHSAATMKTKPRSWDHSLVVLLVNVEAEGVHPEPQLSAFLVLDVEVVDSVHLQVLSDLQILHHGLLPVDVKRRLSVTLQSGSSAILRTNIITGEHTSSCLCVLRATLESSPPTAPCWACADPELWKHETAECQTDQRLWLASEGGWMRKAGVTSEGAGFPRSDSPACAPPCCSRQTLPARHRRPGARPSLEGSRCRRLGWPPSPAGRIAAAWLPGSAPPKHPRGRTWHGT